MRTGRIVVGVLCLSVLVCASPGSAGPEEKDPFRSYSPRARAVIDKMLRTLGKLRSYEDTATFGLETDAREMGGETNWDMSFAYVRPMKFRMKMRESEIICDGKEVTIFKGDSSRYKVKPAGSREDVATLIATHSNAGGYEISMGSLLFAKHPRENIGRAFSDLDVTGRETLGRDRCVVLEGMSKTPGMWTDREVPVTLWLREVDGLLRRLELDLTDLLREQMENAPSTIKFEYYRFVYEVDELKVNEAVDAARFKFEVPETAKKVKEFYSRWTHSSDGAARFSLSGKEAPSFDAETLDGDPITSEALEGKVAVIGFVHVWGNQLSPGVKKLDELDQKYRDANDVAVLVVAVYVQDKDRLRELLAEQEIDVPFVADKHRGIASSFHCDGGGATVLINKKGVIQGRFIGFLTDHTTPLVARDIDTLRGGKDLAGGKAMTEEELDELEEQSAYRGSLGKVEPLNEDWLREAWAVRASTRNNMYWGGGQGRPQADDRGIWVRHRERLRRVGPGGDVEIEIPIGDRHINRMGAQGAIVPGRIGPRGSLGVVIVEPIQSEDEERGSYYPAAGATLIALDEEGEEAWTLELRAERHRSPQHVFLADIDGRAGDELIFLMQSVLYVVDGEGEIRVRKKIEGLARWMIVEDRDRDRKAEIYVRTQTKLHRFDYRPGR
jgi:outer membrane lipoprotein-sorting protein/peroxiredoxin